MRYAGVGSYTTVADAIKHFEKLKLVQVFRRRGQLQFRGVNRYRISADDPDFQSLVTKSYQQVQEEVAIQRQARADERETRRAAGVVGTEPPSCRTNGNGHHPSPGPPAPPSAIRPTPQPRRPYCTGTPSLHCKRQTIHVLGKPLTSVVK